MTDNEIIFLVVALFWLFVSLIQMLMIFMLARSVSTLKNLLFISQRMNRFEKGLQDDPAR